MDAGSESQSIAVAPPRSPLARLSFWCGVATWVAAFLAPILQVFAFLLVYPLAFIAVGIGVAALLHIRRTRRAWRGARWAIAGIVMGGLWLLFLAVALVAGAV
jgi:hypothetical protein